MKRSYIILAFVLGFIVTLLFACTAKTRNEFTFQDKLVWYDDSTLNIRCYRISGLDGISCLPKPGR